MNIFRFPGGKYRQRNRFLDLLKQVSDPITHYCEPFVGGGSVALRVAQEYPDAQLWINDFDPRMAAFWNVTVNGDVERLCKALEETEVTTSLFRTLKELPENASQDELAFAAVYLNRTSFSGKSHTSPSGGWNQDTAWANEHQETKAKPAIMREWRPHSFIPAIRQASELLKGRTLVSASNFRDTIEGWGDYTLYIDPPYYKAGKSMYPVFLREEDHQVLSETLKGLHDRWVLSYDNVQQVKDLYSWAAINETGWAYGTAFGKERKNQTEKYLNRELIITRRPV